MFYLHAFTYSLYPLTVSTHFLENDELKEACRALGLAVTGIKSVLLARLGGKEVASLGSDLIVSFFMVNSSCTGTEKEEKQEELTPTAHRICGT